MHSLHGQDSQAQRLRNNFCTPHAFTPFQLGALLKVRHQLRDAGNTIVVIEHNLDVTKTADWLIDMGPEGGSGGGTAVGVGTPEAIDGIPASYTGLYLKPLLT
jgi:excinuclease ABC subunit A